MKHPTTCINCFGAADDAHCFLRYDESGNGKNNEQQGTNEVSDVDFISAPFDEAPEEQLPKEKMYPLHIKNVEVGSTRGGDGKQVRRMITCLIEIEENDEEGRPFQPIFHMLVLPNKEETESPERKEREGAKMMLRNTRRFLHVFGVDVGAGGFNPSDLEDARGSCVVFQRVREDNKEIVPALRLPRVK